jgi:hypothetical protein
MGGMGKGRKPKTCKCLRSTLHRIEHSKLKTTEVIWEGDWEVVKRSGRDEAIWVEVHLGMEAMLKISLCSYAYLN